MNVKISVIIPCYNESENILLLIQAIHQVLEGQLHEIVVVDDNSPDGTYQIVMDAHLAYVKAILRKGTPSLGGAIGEGIRQSTGEYIVVMDSDFNHQPKDVLILVNNLKYFDCVSASRFVYGGDMGNRFRHLASWIFNIFTRIITRTMITDSLFGFFAIHRKTLNEVPFDAVFYGYGDYCIRLFYYLQKNQISMLQIPGVLGKRHAGEGNRRFFKTFLNYFREVLKLSVKLNTGSQNNVS